MSGTTDANGASNRNRSGAGTSRAQVTNWRGDLAPGRRHAMLELMVAFRLCPRPALANSLASLPARQLASSPPVLASVQPVCQKRPRGPRDGHSCAQIDEQSS
jgi:hypothetical protein